ncbi:Uncharacterized protein APZ42_018021 [Daphnia magna]|uniref:Uncharacterized protein n=1 Tax=Daphnia magna TaxID=35525 RepID=A0A164ZHF7_9CRUS|nr:Uncharacterized protein APZ42_018021 [Daphnia magna]
MFSCNSADVTEYFSSFFFLFALPYNLDSGSSDIELENRLQLAAAMRKEPNQIFLALLNSMLTNAC